MVTVSFSSLSLLLTVLLLFFSLSLSLFCPPFFPLVASPSFSFHLVPTPSFPLPCSFSPITLIGHCTEQGLDLENKNLCARIHKNMKRNLLTKEHSCANTAITLLLLLWSAPKKDTTVSHRNILHQLNKNKSTHKHHSLTSINYTTSDSVNSFRTKTTPNKKTKKTNKRRANLSFLHHSLILIASCARAVE